MIPNMSALTLNLCKLHNHREFLNLTLEIWMGTTNFPRSYSFKKYIFWCWKTPFINKESPNLLYCLLAVPKEITKSSFLPYFFKYNVTRKLHHCSIKLFYLFFGYSFLGPLERSFGWGMPVLNHTWGHARSANSHDCDNLNTQIFSMSLVVFLGNFVVNIYLFLDIFCILNHMIREIDDLSHSTKKSFQGH